MEVKYAFFDVDETLINMKTMFNFYQFWQSHNFRYIPQIAKFKFIFFKKKIELLGKKSTREDVNIFYYSKFKGVEEKEILDATEKWWKCISKRKDLFQYRVIEQFDDLKKNGFVTVLVSGSLNHCLTPIKEKLGADFLISTNLESKNGILTGKICGEPNIGEGKVREILSFDKQQPHDIDWNNSYAFGDHASDIPMLKLVGNKYIVVNGIPCKIDSIFDN